MASAFGLSRSTNPIARRAVVATVLLLLGVGLAAAYRVISGTQRQAFSVGAVPPSSSQVTEAKTYQLAVPGGVTTLKKRGANVTAAQCEWSVGGSGSQLLQVTAAGPDTKATNVVGTFVSPVTGDIRVDCAGWGAMYIDDADNAPADVAGWFLVLAVIALAVGAGLGVSALRMAGDEAAASARRSTREDDEIERLVHAVHVRSQDEEVLDSDGDDVSR
jgi:hypothetical protein